MTAIHFWSMHLLNIELKFIPFKQMKIHTNEKVFCFSTPEDSSSLGSILLSFQQNLFREEKKNISCITENLLVSPHIQHRQRLFKPRFINNMSHRFPPNSLKHLFCLFLKGSRKQKGLKENLNLCE